MNPRILVAFAAGAMAASGIVLIAMRPASHSAAASITPAGRQEMRIVRAVASAPEAPPADAAVAEIRPASEIVQVQGHGAPPPVRRVVKPSPMPVALKKWPADKPDTVMTAQNEPPAPVSDAGPPPLGAEGSMPVERTTIPPTPPVVEQPPPAVERPAQAPLEARVPHSVTLRPGTLISVRIGETLSSARNQPGDMFAANLDQPLVIDGWVIADRGSRAAGRVIDCGRRDRIEGGSELGVQLTAINTTDGQHIAISTSTFLKRGASWSGNDAAKVGGAAALGAAIGAMAGGGRGAGIGAIVGGAAGAGGVIYTRRSGADIPVETRISFRVDRPATITEKLD